MRVGLRAFEQGPPGARAPWRMATISPSTTRGVCSGLVPPRVASGACPQDTTDAAVPLLFDGESGVVLAAFPCRHTTYRRAHGPAT